MSRKVVSVQSKNRSVIKSYIKKMCSQLTLEHVKVLLVLCLLTIIINSKVVVLNVPRSVSTCCEPTNRTGNVKPSAVAAAAAPSVAELSCDWLNGLTRLQHKVFNIINYYFI